MNDKQINKLLRRQFGAIGWVLVGYWVLMNVLAIAAVMAEMSSAAQAMYLYGTEMDMDKIAGNAWGYILTIAVGLLVLWEWKGREFWKDAIAVKAKPMTMGVLLGALSLCIGTQLVYVLWVDAIELTMNLFDKSVVSLLEQISGSSDTVSMFLYASILAPIAEEILFRGYVLRSLRPYGKRFAILGSAFLFALYHGNLLQMPLAFLMGLVLGWVAAEYSIYWAIGLHMFNNLVMADLLTRATSLFPEPIPGIINLVIFLAFAVISVVLLIVKRREIRAYNQAEGMDRRCLKCFFGSAGILIFTVLMSLNMVYIFTIA